MSFLRLFLPICVVALCLTVGCRDDSSQSRKDGFNLFGRNDKTVEKIPRTADNDLARRITQALQKTVDPEEKNTSQSILHFGMFLAGLAVVIAGLVYWQIWRRGRAEWELNDPMALVQELTLAHQLSDQEKRLMQDISAKNSLSSPLKLFVDPKFLLETWEKDSALSLSTVRTLLSKLFDITMENGESLTVAEELDAKTVYLPRGVQLSEQ